jgi:type IV pilus assembly protein PilV
MNKFRMKGFSLVEVMVSILVLALGVIGAAGMQLTALRTSQQSSLHTMALQLASEMADRVRTNDSQLRRKDADNPFLDLDYSASQAQTGARATLCYSQSCDGDQLADFDLYEWKARLHAALPAGRVVICRDRAPWDSATGALTWRCEKGEGPLFVKVGWMVKNPSGELEQSAGGGFPPAIALLVSPYVP